MNHWSLVSTANRVREALVNNYDQRVIDYRASRMADAWLRQIDNKR